jgi:hypothetical protein
MVQKPTGFTQAGPQWVQDPSGQWHQSGAARQGTNPWTAVGWLVLVLLLIPCVLGGVVVGITALGAASSSTSTTTTMTPVTAVAPPTR